MDQRQTNDWNGALMAARLDHYTGSVVVKSETLLAIDEEIEQLRDVERLISECVPGGSTCDPQQIADAIRRYYDVRQANGR